MSLMPAGIRHEEALVGNVATVALDFFYQFVFKFIIEFFDASINGNALG